MRPLEAVEAVVADLRAGGVRATSDPRDLNRLPAVFVAVDTIREANLCGECETVVALVMVAKDTGNRLALSALSELYEDVRELVEIDGDVTAESVTLPGSAPAPLPAFTARLLPL